MTNDLLPCPFEKWQVWANPDDEIMMVVSVRYSDSGEGYKVEYVTEHGEKGSFWDNDRAIIDNIRQIDTRTPNKPAEVDLDLDQLLYRCDQLGKWMSAALDDPNVCAEMKADITSWFNAQGLYAHESYSKKPEDYTAWLLERHTDDGIDYLCYDQTLTWTKDALKALHFKRREDVDAMGSECLDDVRCVEHMWPKSSGHLATGKGGDAITGDTSDGYHTFNELYEHRHILFLSVLTANIDRAWRSKLHDDGTMFDGWFVAGLKTVMGQATYHLPIRMWSLFDAIPELEKAPPFDGHTAEDTLKRLRDDAYFGHRVEQQKTAEPCGDVQAALDWLYEKATAGCTEFTDQLPDNYNTVFMALKQPAAPTQIDAGELERAIWYCREDWQHKDGYEALYEHMDIIIKAARAHLEKSKGGV